MHFITQPAVSKRIVLSGCKLALLVSLFALIGCGQPNEDPRVFPAHGEITYEGKPVPRGGISFEPDGQQGNSGPQGFAEIIDGKYDTASGGRATTGGAQVVTITGYDGQATEDNPDGTLLFSGWSTTIIFPSEKNPVLNFEVDEKNRASQSSRNR